MPNWTSNEVTISAGRRTIERFIRRHFVIKGGKQVFDFNSIIKMPKGLSGTEKGAISMDADAFEKKQIPQAPHQLAELSMTDEQYGHYLAMCERRSELYAKGNGSNSEGLKYHNEFIQPLLDSIAPIKRFSFYKKRLMARKPESYKMIKLILSNKRRYGYADWYDWSVDNWGTKWNAGRTEIELSFADSGGLLVIRFDTAWDLPRGIMDELKTMYEDLAHFEWNANHEDGGDEDFSFGNEDFSERPFPPTRSIELVDPAKGLWK